jgi:hypothetical protein
MSPISPISDFRPISVNVVLPGAADEQIAAFPGEQRIIPRSAHQRVIAFATDEHVVGRTGEQPQRRLRLSSTDHIIAVLPINDDSAELPAL